MNKWVTTRYLLLLGLTGLFVACDADRVYEAYRDFEDGLWNLEEAATFDIGEIHPQPSIPVLAVRYTDDYEYHNLYVRFVQQDSMASVLQDTLVNIALFDAKSGKPLGKGFGNRHTIYDTLLGKEQILPNASRILIRQYMRKEQLAGIESVGIKLVATDN